jgi:hypothetical protein
MPYLSPLIGSAAAPTNKQQRLSRNKKIMSKMWGALALAAAAGFSYFMFEDGRENRAINKNGAEATVEPITQYREVRRKGEGTGYSVDLKFKASNGANVTIKRIVSKNVIDQFASNQPVKVRYLPNDTSALRVVGNEESWFMNFLMWGITIFFWVFGIGALMHRSSEE